jgi:hypothetical protein
MRFNQVKLQSTTQRVPREIDTPFPCDLAGFSSVGNEPVEDWQSKVAATAIICSVKEAKTGGHRVVQDGGDLPANKINF